MNIKLRKYIEDNNLTHIYKSIESLYPGDQLGLEKEYELFSKFKNDHPELIKLLTHPIILDSDSLIQ